MAPPPRSFSLHRKLKHDLRWPARLAALAALALASDAVALQQPNNKIIPVGPSLQNLFNTLGDPINALSDAKVVPETFLPACEVEFEVLQRNAGYKNSFGWYNVTEQKPTLADLHQILSCNDGVGITKIAAIKADPAYKGGEVGFFQATGACADIKQPNSIYNIFFSEVKWNPDAQQNNPFIHLIIYESVLNPRTYYFAWEDLIQGGDDDFDDLTTRVKGITCFNGPPCQPFVDPTDPDNDGICGMADNCPDDLNQSQLDADEDGVGDACDNCADDPNADQADSDQGRRSATPVTSTKAPPATRATRATRTATPPPPPTRPAAPSPRAGPTPPTAPPPTASPPGPPAAPQRPPPPARPTPPTAPPAPLEAPETAALALAGPPGPGAPRA
jgi:hypothetical protein